MNITKEVKELIPFLYRELTSPFECDSTNTKNYYLCLNKLDQWYDLLKQLATLEIYFDSRISIVNYIAHESILDENNILEEVQFYIEDGLDILDLQERIEGTQFIIEEANDGIFIIYKK